MKRAAIIGGGPAGVCVLRHLGELPDLYEPVCFERAGQTGGLWIYTDNVGLDDDGLPVHSSMYKSLRSNFPKEILCFPDFPQKIRDISYLPRADVLNYIQEYAQHFDVEKYIKFKTWVHTIKPVNAHNGTTKWDVTYQEVATLGKEHPVTEKFDIVFICTGHYESPNIPTIPGDDVFKGRILHSHEFRVPEAFAGQRVVTLGGNISGIDITLDLAKTADQVYFAHRYDPYTSTLPSNVRQMPGIRHLTEHSAVFDNGEEHVIDALLLCTGYLFHLPFLDDACAIKTDGSVISNLYKHMINVDFPSMFFIGFTKEVIAFHVLDIQTKYILKVLNGSVRLPSKQAMLASTVGITNTKPRYHISKSTAHFMHMDQFSYMDDLTTEAGLPPCPAFIEPIYRYTFESIIENLQGRNNVKVEVVGSSSFRVHPLSE